ncbi:MAG: hypothetical protein JWR29_440 [Tardiphaga sp.]|nr:hypothetical protein [Tardiphaga sp.]
MTMLTARSMRRGWRRSRRRGYLVPILIACVIGGGAIAAIGYLLWPTWTQKAANNPDRIPISVGATLFNVPAAAFRIKVQKHSGPQERVDLSFDYPSLQAPSAPHPVSIDTIDENAQPIRRIFLSIAAHNNALSPDQRVRTIYPRYFDNAAPTPAQNGLSWRAFRENSPYAGDDVFFANDPVLIARCTREGDTPGMCLSERRIEGTDLTFRFPRAWLTQDWRNVASAMDRLTMQLRGARG